MGRKPTNSSSSHSHSHSSSIESSSYPSISSSASSLPNHNKKDLSTDLRLGLTFSTSVSPNSREQRSADWPPIKPLLRNTLAEKGKPDQVQKQNKPIFFVKVYMEGLPIGRKLDLFAHHDYATLIRTLQLMFGTTILCPDQFGEVLVSRNSRVLTYEDREGDWMMVGDVPWEMFLSAVKRLKITRADKC